MLPPLPSDDEASRIPETVVCPSAPESRKIRPPSPPLGPPLASKVPSARVTESGFFTSDPRTTVPPSPLSVALASSRAPFSTIATVAGRMLSSFPCQLPPTKTSPPPVAPDALRCAPDCTSTCSPVAAMLPPLPSDDEASRIPETVVCPPAPESRKIRPSRFSIPCARTSPPVLMTEL